MSGALPTRKPVQKPTRWSVDWLLYLKETIRLRVFGFFKIPALAFVSPSVLEVSESRCVVRIRLRRRTRNHLNSMYFGVLAIGADCAGGLIAMNQIRALGANVGLIFKNFHADFLKRAEGDVFFTCEQGLEIRQLVQKAMDTGVRQSMPVQITATVPSRFGDEAVAKFVLTLSLKKR
jgi:acyl-coenzyme A thioesterase PaaI-like protein